MPDALHSLERPHLTAPIVGSFGITPADTGEFAQWTRAIWVGTGGNISILHADGTSGIYVNVPSGFHLAVRAQRVNLTGTTASNLLGNY